MSEAFSPRVQELRLLGWTDDGAQQYSDLFDQSQIKMNLSQVDVVFAGIALAVILICALVYLNRYLDNKNTKQTPISKEVVEVRSIEAKTDVREIELRRKPEIALIESTAEVIGSTANAIEKTFNPLLNTNEKKKPFLDYFSELFDDTSIDPNRLPEHILLATVLTSESLLKAFKLISKKSEEAPSKSKAFIGKNQVKKALSKKTNDELREILNGIELVSACNNKQLKDLILTNPEAFQRISFEERKEELMKMRKEDLKMLLNGVSKISRLNKPELVEKVLCQEFQLE